MKLLKILPFVSVFCACIPTTQFVRTASVSSPSGETLTLPLHGDVELSGNVAYNDAHPVDASGLAYAIHPPSSVPPYYFTRLTYQPGDSLTNPSMWKFSGQVRFRVHPNVALGMQGLAELSPLRDHLNLPLDSGAVYGLGPNISIHFNPAGTAEEFSVGVSAAFTMMLMPWETLEAISQSNVSHTFAFNRSNYVKQRSGADWLPMFRVSVGANYLLEQRYEFFSGLSFQNSVRNIGFDNHSSQSSTLTADVLNLVPFMGAGIVFKPFFARAQVYLPLVLSHAEHVHVGTQLQIGATL